MINHDWNQENIEKAIEKAEAISLDLKRGGEFTGDFAEKLTLTIASMANSKNGGVIFIGFDDDKTPVDCTPYLPSWDRTKVTNQLKKRLDPVPKIEIIQKQYHGKTVLIVEVAEFEETPIVLTESIQVNGKKYSAGSIFIRTVGAESKVISSAEEMRNFLRIAVAKRTEQITRDIEEIINGSKKPKDIPVEQKFHESLPEWTLSVFQKEFRLASLETKVLPINARNKQSSFDEICRHVVYDNPNIHGHSFPYYYDARENLKKKNKYIENFIQMDKKPYQFWQLQYDGALGIASTIWSETEKDHDAYWRDHISLSGICDLIFESYIVARNIARLYDADSVFLKLSLTNIEGKKLGDKPTYRLRAHQSHVNSVSFERQYSLAEIVNLDKHVNDGIAEILNAFSEFRYDYTPTMRGWQN